MRACLQCGKVLPRHQEKGHREREYCSAVCRQRAWRARNQDKHNFDRIMQQAQERFVNAAYQEAHSETWQHELKLNEMIIGALHMQIELQEGRISLLEGDLESAELDKRLLSLEVERLKDQLAEAEVEIARLNALLNPIRPRRSRPPQTQ